MQKTVSNWGIFFGWIWQKHGQVFCDIVSKNNDRIEKIGGQTCLDLGDPVNTLHNSAHIP